MMRRIQNFRSVLDTTPHSLPPSFNPPTTRNKIYILQKGNKNDTYNRKNNENIPIDRSDGTR